MTSVVTSVATRIGQLAAQAEAELDTGLLAPEQVGHEHHVAFFGVVVGHFIQQLVGHLPWGRNLVPLSLRQRIKHPWRWPCLYFL